MFSAGRWQMTENNTNPLKRSGTSPFHQFRVNGTPWALNGLAVSNIYVYIYIHAYRFDVRQYYYTFCPIPRVGVSIVLSSFFPFYYFAVTLLPGKIIKYEYRYTLLRRKVLLTPHRQ